MSEAELKRRLEALTPPGVEDARERTKLAARASLAATHRLRRRQRRFAGFLAAAATAAAALLLVVGVGGGPGSGPTRAIGGNLARLLEVSPPILLDAPGWGVEYTDESFRAEGLTNFFRGAGGVSPTYEAGHEGLALRSFLELQWSDESLEKRLRDFLSVPRKLRRAYEQQGIPAPPEVTREVAGAPVLGTTARVLVHTLPGEPYFEAIALWEQRGRLFVVRSFVPDLETFRARLAALRRVDPETWLEALEDRIVVHKKGGVEVMPPNSQKEDR